ncbi:tRNA-splicing endonuclease subunit sen54-like protein [Podospora didyma]|uniref:tRNA-splicing endonuclease subunit sen54-like protein n=1 Tax=Podospora didyma TaxID=330526 RepID=A0AAE0NSZ9_9PEZI|nr:tRNA-splicing endonuclease subunit sen54-like protein [Podospora didyma]
MAFDDDDMPMAVPLAQAASAAAAAEIDGGLTAEDALEEETQDFLAFAKSFRKGTHISAQTIRRGEKDFESHGTRAQENALEQSRAAMKDVLSYTRIHTQQNWIRGWYFPDWWADAPEEEEEESDGKESGAEKKASIHVRDRVVILENTSVSSMNIGRAITGQPKEKPGRGKDWLLPEEALYLMERGSLDLWWPTRGLEEIFPVESPDATNVDGSKPETTDAAEEADEYEKGVPLSVQAAYALLVGNDGERGKVSLNKFQVYSNLKRAGYNVLRAPHNQKQAVVGQEPLTTTTLWQWLSSLLARKEVDPKPFGPLVQPGLYRSYIPIYTHMAIIPRHKPSASRSSPWQPQAPFEIHYHIWKTAQKWTKIRHPAPDFYMAVVDAQESAVPSFEEITALIDATPLAPGKPEWSGPGRLYARLKHGHRNVLVAVVDHGVINYMRFAEGAFGEELLFQRFDGRGITRGGKQGGGGGGRGRGGARGGGAGSRGGGGGRGGNRGRK